MAERDTYEVQNWEDLPSENTPVSAKRLGHIEQGIENAMNNRALKSVYGDNAINLTASEDGETLPIVISKMVSGERQGLYTFDRSGNMFLAGDVENGNGVSLDGLKTAIDNMESGEGGGADVPIANYQDPGKVKPDGTTITIDADGTIHAVSSQELADSVLGGES